MASHTIQEETAPTLAYPTVLRTSTGTEQTAGGAQVPGHRNPPRTFFSGPHWFTFREAERGLLPVQLPLLHESAPLLQ